MNKKVPNYTYGVDTNDKEAIKEAYKKYRTRHIVITFFVVIVLAFLGVIIFDFYQVNANGKLPIISLKEKVDGGTLYKALGYKVLYCDNGDRYVGFMALKTCSDKEGSNQFKDILFNAMSKYLKDNKLIDYTNLTGMELLEYSVDEVESNGNTDYLVKLKYTCLDGTNKCLNLGIEYETGKDIELIVGVDKYQVVNKVSYFKKSGNYYQSLNDKYAVEIQDYLNINGNVDVDNLRYLKINLLDDYGVYKFNGFTYAKAYRARLSYTCKDDSNSCVRLKKDIDIDENLNYEIAIFVDSDMKVKYIDKALVFEV